MKPFEMLAFSLHTITQRDVIAQPKFTLNIPAENTCAGKPYHNMSF